MKSTSRQPGWSAVANSQKAHDAFSAWCTHSKTLDVPTLVLARDYAVMKRKGKKVVDAINLDLRNTVHNQLGEHNMTTTETDVEQPKTARITLTAPGSRLTLMAMRRPDGTAVSFATTTDVETKKTTRGMTEKHQSFDAAQKAISQQASDAAKLGWSHRRSGGGFVARPDAFSAIPTPKASKSKK